MKQEDFYQPSFMKVIAPVALKFFSSFFEAHRVSDESLIVVTLFYYIFNGGALFFNGGGGLKKTYAIKK